MTEGNHYTLSESGVDVYEQHIVPGVMAPFARGLVEAARLQVGEQVLDVACGTGIVSRLAWPQIAMSGSIVGVDLSASMLDTARRVAADHRMPVKWEHGDAASLPLASKTVDVVLCQHGLQYFPNRAAALREMHRVLKPSGRTVINVWRPVHYNPGHAAFADALERHVSDAAAAERRAPFALSERSELRSLLREAGFQDVVVTLDARVARFPSAEAMIQIMLAGSPLANIMAETDPATMQLVIAEVETSLSFYEDDLGLALPMQAWVLTAKA